MELRFGTLGFKLQESKDFVEGPDETVKRFLHGCGIVETVDGYQDKKCDRIGLCGPHV